MRGIGIALAGLMWMAQPALAQEPPLTYDWVSQASPAEVRTRLLGALAPMYRDVSAPRRTGGGFSINFASAPRSAGPSICVSDVMTVELSPIFAQHYSLRDLEIIEVRPQSVSTRDTYLYLEDAPQSTPTGEVSPGSGSPIFDFDRVRTNEMCAEHSNGWTFTGARDGYLFKLGVDLLRSVKDLAANNPTAFAALLNDCEGFGCSSVPTWIPNSSTDDISGVAEVDCQRVDGVHAVDGRCLVLVFLDGDNAPISILGRRDETFQWRALKFVTFVH